MSSPLVSPNNGMSAQDRPETGQIERIESISGLAAIGRPEIDLVIWRRTLPAELIAWIDRLAASDLPDLRILIEPDRLVSALNAELEAEGLPAGRMRDLLVADIEGLVLEFASITGVGQVDVRLECIDHDACKKFHRDWVEARLVTTYRGPATEWVPQAHGEQALKDQEGFDGPLERLKQHDVAFFKGCHSGSGRGVVHRSPPVAKTGQTRLLLCLNQPSNVSPQLWRPDLVGLSAS